MISKKIILVTSKPYHPDYAPKLQSIIDKGYELFCATGIGCELWEEIMDEMAVGDGTETKTIVTTSHPSETLSEVLEFAKHCCSHLPSGIDVMRI